ncbi:MAG: aldo/keto reductase [Gammaproteobacteria bacterium]
MINRRQFMGGMAAAAFAPTESTCAGTLLRRTVPSSGASITAIGMGTWLTFDVIDSEHELAIRTRVLDAFFSGGGELIDSSPMYGSSEAAIGECLSRLEGEKPLFSAGKVWTIGRWLGTKQMQHSMKLWRQSRIDLMQVHNLLDWKAHLSTLRAWKAEGHIRYIGLTTSHGRRHMDIVEIMKAEPVDFVQISYNILDREAEREILPVAMSRGIAVIANRPFQSSRLFDRVRNKPLPGWGQEINCRNWAQVFLKFILSHRGVTCAIPATSRVDHMVENMGALTGSLPDPSLRRRIVDDYLNI